MNEERYGLTCIRIYRYLIELGIVSCVEQVNISKKALSRG